MGRMLTCARQEGLEQRRPVERSSVMKTQPWAWDHCRYKTNPFLLIHFSYPSPVGAAWDDRSGRSFCGSHGVRCGDVAPFLTKRCLCWCRPAALAAGVCGRYSQILGSVGKTCACRELQGEAGSGVRAPPAASQGGGWGSLVPEPGCTHCLLFAAVGCRVSLLASPVSHFLSVHVCKTRMSTGDLSWGALIGE